MTSRAMIVQFAVIIVVATVFATCHHALDITMVIVVVVIVVIFIICGLAVITAVTRIACGHAGNNELSLSPVAVCGSGLARLAPSQTSTRRPIAAARLDRSCM